MIRIRRAVVDFVFGKFLPNNGTHFVSQRRRSFVEISSSMSSKGRSRKHMKVEYDEDKKSDSKSSDEADLAENASGSKRKPAKSTESTLSAEGKADSTSAPKDWEIVYQNIKEMRKKNDAPVDTMGCERTMDPNTDEKTRRYQTLISLMLSSQTKDQITFAAMDKLKAHGLTPQNILITEDSILKDLIYPVGFYKRKVEYIKNTTKILVDQYDSDILGTIEGLLKLPGVGPKMGYICLSVAWGRNDGIGVDTHVHRICDRLGWMKNKKGKNSTPEDTRKALESWLPENLWQEINILLVGFGQMTCLPVNPKCNECLNKTICPFGRSNSKSKSKK